MKRFHQGCFGTLILRVSVGLIFLQHGLMKLMMPSTGMMNMVGGAAYNVGLTFFSPVIRFWVAAIVETVFGVTLILGLFTRLSALILAIEMLFILNMKGWMISTSELEYLLLVTLVSLLFTGGKRYSLDAAMAVSYRSDNDVHVAEGKHRRHHDRHPDMDSI